MIIKNKEKGVSLIIAFFVMIIIIAVVLALSVLSYGQIKILKNIAESVSAFYVADTGVEVVLYYDRAYNKGKTTMSHCGACNICNDFTKGDHICGLGSDNLPSCKCKDSVEITNCNSCTSSFYENYGSVGKVRTYVVEAKVDANGKKLEINSTGIFNNIGRAINVISENK